MNFSLKFIFAATTWIAWCVFAILSGHLWVYDTTELLGWIVLSAMLALPFISSTASRSFWTLFATPKAVFLLLAAVENESFVRLSNTIAYKLVDSYVAIFGTSDGLGNPYLKTNILGILIRIHCGPLFGLISAFAFQRLRPTPSDKTEQ